MIPRKRLDIRWLDLFFAAGCCLLPGRKNKVYCIQQSWSSTQPSLVCLSVRSGFDALLQALNFAPGSEILVSAVTIRGMIQILEAHNLVPVPVDVDMSMLAVHPTALQAAVTPRTRAVLVAHLFGSRMPMAPIIQFTQAHGLQVIEDCAQAYVGPAYRGHPQSDVCLFSFGPIKTATALGGGILQFQSATLRDAVQVCQSQWPVQRRWQFGIRVTKYAGLIALSTHWAYTLFAIACRLMGIDRDRIISSAVRGFSDNNFLVHIRQRPCAPLLALLHRRLRQFRPESIDERIDLAQALIDLTPGLRYPGNMAPQHSYWVFPILCKQPEQVRQILERCGFDATQGGSSLYVVDAPTEQPTALHPIRAQQAFGQLLYLPIYAGLSQKNIERLAKTLQQTLHIEENRGEVN